MRRCKSCRHPINYSGFGRPREYCEDCRQNIKHRPDPDSKICQRCGYYFTGGGEWQTLCSEECWYDAVYLHQKKNPAPAPTLARGGGPWVWEVGERYLVTRKPNYPHNAGPKETVRCGIMADFADRTTAENYAQQQAQRRAS